jgi:glycosyltransferase involved in cell wall biosynthesis
VRIAIVAANSVEFDSRLRRTASALAGDGHDVTIVGFGAAGLPDRDVLPGAPAVTVVRVGLDRRLSEAFRPLPGFLRNGLSRLLGIDPAATVLPPSRGGVVERLSSPIRRLVEIVAVVRRTGGWTRLVLEAVPGVDVYHAKALIALPVIHDAARARGARFVYDVADLHTEAARLARMPGWVRRVVRGREGRWVRDAAGLTAVSDGIADEAVRRFGVPRPVVVRNCPPAWRSGEPQPDVQDRLRPAAGLPAERTVVLYQGGFSVDRGIEELVAALDAPALRGRDVAAVFLGYGRLRAWLLDEAQRRPGRLVVLDAVPPDELLEWTTSADVGYVGLPPRTLNQRLNLSNKLFESLMAGLPVVVAAGTEHCRVVEAEGVGVCVDGERPEAIADGIARLLSAPAYERDRLRSYCRTVALARYTWELEQAGLLALYRSLSAETAAEITETSGSAATETESA